MQVDLMIGSSRWSDSAALARSVEAAGLSGMVFTETGQTPWLYIAAAAVAAPIAHSRRAETLGLQI